MSTTRVFIHVQHLLGTGHARRAAVLARSLLAQGFAVTVASGGTPIPGLDWGGADLIQLPPLRARDASFKNLVDERDRPIDDAWRESRKNVLLSAWAAAKAQVLITELFPFGRRALRFELLPLLDLAQAASPRPLILCSLRDIVAARPDPTRQAEILDLVKRYFAAVMVHGDPELLPLDASFPAAPRLGARLHYTGYVLDPAPPPYAVGEPGHGEVIVSAGGGAVGERLMAAALAARPLTRAATATWRFLVGPAHPGGANGLNGRASSSLIQSGIVVEPARPDFLRLLPNCRLAIGQGGYNTLMETVRVRVPAVVVPFAGGGETEQTMRVERLRELGYVHAVAEADLEPRRLAKACDAALEAGTPQVISWRMDGAATAARLVRRWADEHQRAN
jgi:predicted glycosyltransferase